MLVSRDRLSEVGLCRFRQLILGAEASSTEVKPYQLAISGSNDSGMDIGYPAAVGPAFRVAYIMAKLR